ncbi:MAG: hypothetical protein JWP97_2173 [Labilithrix sp.]|nr:hypothetical protein [Labilithrix sp.]
MGETRPCETCKHPLTFGGIRNFRTGGQGGLGTFFFGQWAEASEELLPLAIWGCTTCGRIQLFLPTVTP